MNLLDQVVGVLNNRLFTVSLTDGVFDGSKIYGLSYLALPTDDSPVKPYTLRQGEPVFVDITDNYPATVYHRLNGITMTQDQNIGWGDGDGYVNAKFDMYFVMFGNPEFVAYTNEDLILKVSAAMNYTLTSGDINGVGLRSVRASVVRANANSLQVFQGEYGATANCPVRLNSVYFGINYQIEITATNECLACFDCTQIINP